MANNIAHPFLWNISDYFIFKFLCSTKQKNRKNVYIQTHKTSVQTSIWLNKLPRTNKILKNIFYLGKTKFLNKEKIFNKLGQIERCSLKNNSEC